MGESMKGNKQSGFTLIEALVAVLILSVGLLGVAAMQLKAMQSSHVAYQRSVATLAAQDAVDRLWRATALAGGTCSDIDDSNPSDYYDNWSAEFPGLVNPVTPDTSGSCKFVIDISWDDERFLVDQGEEDVLGDGTSENVSTLKYRTQVPGS